MALDAEIVRCFFLYAVSIVGATRWNWEDKE